MRNRRRSDDIDRCSTQCTSRAAPGTYTGAPQRIPQEFSTSGALDQPRSGLCPVVATCDEQLAAIDPALVVHQVKETFGALLLRTQRQAEHRTAGDISPKPNACPPSPAHAAAANSESCACATSGAKGCAPQALTRSAILRCDGATPPTEATERRGSSEPAHSVNGQVEVSAGGQMKVSSPCGNS